MCWVCECQYDMAYYSLTVYIVTKSYERDFNEDPFNRFESTYRLWWKSKLEILFDVAKNCLTLYNYLNSWQKFNETSLPDKKEFYSNWKTE